MAPGSEAEAVERIARGVGPRACEGRRRRGPAEEEVAEEVHRVRELEDPRVVHIERVQAERRRAAEEEIGEDSDGVRDVDPEVGVGVAADEGRSAEGTVDDVDPSWTA